jgi:hypothetical protein
MWVKVGDIWELLTEMNGGLRINFYEIHTIVQLYAYASKLTNFALVNFSSIISKTYQY